MFRPASILLRVPSIKATETPQTFPRGPGCSISVEAMEDEILDLSQFRPAGVSWQRALIARTCEAIEERIRSAPDRRAAELLADDACGRFDATCESSIIRTLLRRRVEELIEKHWKS
jgi:hypothetical protein